MRVGQFLGPTNILETLFSSFKNLYFLRSEKDLEQNAVITLANMANSKSHTVNL